MPLLGEEIAGWFSPERPTAGIILKGEHVLIEPLTADCHSKDLFEAYSEDANQTIWDYLPYGPFNSELSYASWITKYAAEEDPFFLAIKDLKSNRYVGVASYLRINPEHGTIEVGHLNFSPSLQSTTGATEAMYLMMKWVFTQGYRRYEWKCDSLNQRSRQAAQRFGFSYEGVFRQAAIVKGRNRDTAWFSIIDKDWPLLKKTYESWLNANNFDMRGRQRQSLSELTSIIINCHDPMC